MTAGLDCGPVYTVDEIRIGAEETAGELHDRLAELGGNALVKNLPDILSGKLAPATQDEALANYAGKIQKEHAELDWTLDADELQRRVRAYNPVPGAFFHVDDKRIKCWGASCIADVEAPTGTVVACGQDGIVIACGKDALRLEELQLPGKRRVTAREFAGQLDLSGRRLG